MEYNGMSRKETRTRIPEEVTSVRNAVTGEVSECPVDAGCSIAWRDLVNGEPIKAGDRCMSDDGGYWSVLREGNLNIFKVYQDGLKIIQRKVEQ